ncbi:MAG: EamA family transporter [Gammaproteobacteria bacterium]|nr:EamA family transporter [Gammaproteobacteria bacterium]
MGVMVAVIWGGGFLFAKVAIEHFPPILLMALRFTVTALVLVWFVPIPKQQLGRLFWVALIGAAVQYSLTFTGLKHIYASTAIIVIQLEVPFAVLIAVAFLKDRVDLIKITGMALAFVGVVVIAGEPHLKGDLFWVFIVGCGAFTWAIGQVMIKSLGPVGGFTLIAWIAVFAAPQLYIASWLVEDQQIAAVREATWVVWAVVAYMGVVMTAVGYAMWYHLLGKYPVYQVAPFLLLLPVTTVLGGVLLLGEALTTRLIVGGLLAVGGVAVINLIHRKPGKEAEIA